MRLCWEIEDVARLDLEYAFRPNTVNVSGILVDNDYQGLGIGTALMRAACLEADQEDIEIWVVPTSIDNRPKDLERFYSRLGFKSWQGSGYWIRHPKTRHSVCCNW